MSIIAKSHGKFEKTLAQLHQILNYNPQAVLERYGQMGVEYLRDATPVDSGLTANSWHYQIEKTVDTVGGNYIITWYNTNINDGCNIALLLQHGHGTKDGFYIQGFDYINPALAPVYEGLSKTIYEGVIK